jgi:DNA repair photolyase
MLRLPHGVKDLFARWLDTHFPDRRDRVLNRVRSVRSGCLNDSRFGARMRGEGVYAEQIGRLFEMARRRAGLEAGGVALRTDAFRRPDPGSQLSLFGS